MNKGELVDKVATSVSIPGSTIFLLNLRDPEMFLC